MLSLVLPLVLPPVLLPVLLLVLLPVLLLVLLPVLQLLLTVFPEKPPVLCRLELHLSGQILSLPTMPLLPEHLKPVLRPRTVSVSGTC